MSPMSAPAANTLAPPVRTTARISASSSSSESASVSSAMSSGLSAFSTLGRLSVITPTVTSRSMRMFSYPMAVSSGMWQVSCETPTDGSRTTSASR